MIASLLYVTAQDPRSSLLPASAAAATADVLEKILQDYGALKWCPVIC